MFLTDAEIRRLTGLRGREQQIEWLVRHGIRHFVNAAGKPIVPKSVIDTPWKQTEGTAWAPDYSKLRLG